MDRRENPNSNPTVSSKCPGFEIVIQSEENTTHEGRILKKGKKRKYISGPPPTNASSDGPNDKTCQSPEMHTKRQSFSLSKSNGNCSNVVDSIKNVDHDKLTPPEEKDQVPVKETLPLIFQFEDEEPPPPEKEEWEKEVDDLFVELEMCELESQIGFTNPSVSPTQSDCEMGKHDLYHDEQIGLICRVCGIVHLESKYISPPFAKRTPRRKGRKSSVE